MEEKMERKTGNRRKERKKTSEKKKMEVEDME